MGGGEFAVGFRGQGLEFRNQGEPCREEFRADLGEVLVPHVQRGQVAAAPVVEVLGGCGFEERVALFEDTFDVRDDAPSASIERRPYIGPCDGAVDGASDRESILRRALELLFELDPSRLVLLDRCRWSNRAPRLRRDRVVGCVGDDDDPRDVLVSGALPFADDED